MGDTLTTPYGPETIRASGLTNSPTGERVRDWRTIDPALLADQGEGLQTYREKIDELLAADEERGQYVVIVGREIMGLFPDLGLAVAMASASNSGAPVFIKKVVALEPIHSLGGATLAETAPYKNR